MPKEKSFRFTLNDKLHIAAKIKAARTGTTMADVCRKALQNWVDQLDATEITANKIDVNLITTATKPS